MPPRLEGQAPLVILLFDFCSFFGRFWWHFGSILSLGGCPETPRRPFAAHLCPRTPQSAILGSFWEPLGTPFGTLLGPVWGSGSILEALGRHFGSIFGPFGRLSVSTSFWDLKNDQKLTFFRVADVAEV